jgi:hypothetical protein
MLAVISAPAAVLANTDTAQTALLNTKRSLEVEKQQCTKTTDSDAISVTPCSGPTELETLRHQNHLLFVEKKILDVDQKLWLIEKLKINNENLDEPPTELPSTKLDAGLSQNTDELQVQLQLFKQMKKRIQDNNKVKKIEMVEGYLRLKDKELQLRSSILNSAIKACELQRTRKSLVTSEVNEQEKNQALTREIRNLFDIREKSALELSNLTYGQYWRTPLSMSETLDDATVRQLEAIENRCQAIELKLQELSKQGR